MAVIVDTNVAIVASGHSTQADAKCADVCVKRLAEIMKAGGLLLDDSGFILQEYTKNLGHSGQPGAGEAFVKWAFDNQAISRVVTRVSITMISNGGWRKFEEFPDKPALQKFDKSDQKFVAVAVASGTSPAILNAVDSDWSKHRAALAAAKIKIQFLCPQHCS